LEKEDNSKLSLKEQMALHRETPSCARCHNKIDPWGIAFEAYDATGQIKKASYDATTILPGGAEVDGLKGLQTHIIESKSNDFANGLVRRITGYALGRQLEFSDDELIQDLTKQLVANNFRPSSLIEGIVTSPTFLTK